MDERFWKVILASLNQGNCVALVGPGLYTTAANGELQNLATMFSHHLVEELNYLESERKIEIWDPDNLPIVAQCFSESYSPEVLREEVIEFYTDLKTRLEKGEGQDTVFESLAALPISLFISIRHDHTLAHYLRARGKSPIEKAYDLNGNQQRTLGELGSIGRPIVYRLLGSMDEPRSLALTESDLLDLLKNIISGNPALPKDLSSAFKDKSFLFLGCGLHSYYMRVLLHILEVDKSGKQSFAPDAISARKDKGAFRTSVWFYEVGYKALRLLDVEEREFILELRKRWDEKHPEGTFQPSSSAEEEDEETDRPEVFISYMSEDEDYAKRLVQALKSKGVKPWLDKDELRGGDRWDYALKDAIGKVDFFIVLLSKHLNDLVETYVHKEVAIALERKSRKGANVKFIFPIRIDREAPLLDAIKRANIQASALENFDTDVANLAKDIRKQFAKLQRR